MSWSRYYEINCDWLTDGLECQNESGLGYSLADARREARAAGWLRLDDGDYCPEHAEVAAKRRREKGSSR